MGFEFLPELPASRWVFSQHARMSLSVPRNWQAPPVAGLTIRITRNYCKRAYSGRIPGVFRGDPATRTDGIRPTHSDLIRPGDLLPENWFI